MPQRIEPVDLFAGDGEMSRLMRAHDWAATPLGPVECWPQSLKTAVRIILGSRYPMFIWWGRGLINLYNDGYLPMLGKRHPVALGKSAAVIWSEIWDTVGPQTDAVLSEGRATWNEERLLVLERNGYPEEAYFTFSYSPMPADDGGVGGIFCALTEDTQRVLGQRRMRTLRELAARTTGARTVEQACQAALDTLAQNLHDLPFTAIYLLEGEGDVARLAGTTGLADGASVCPPAISLTSAAGRPACWPLGRVAATGRAESVERLEDRCGRLQCGVWPDPPQSAIVLPVLQSGQDRMAGFLVAGISPRRVFDDDYRGFTDLLAGQIATAVADARAYEEERKRAEALAGLDRAKTTFFSNVSHEFRTPLTLILGPLEDALAEPGGSLPPAQRERLEIAHRNGLRLQKLVNTLLDFSRIEAGRVQASYEPTDLAAFTAELASNFRSACEKAGLRLVVDCPPLAEPVYVDRDMWEKIVLNLVANAFKYTLDGGIEVGLRRADGQVELTVRDTGTGIPADEMPKLFERFHRVEGSRGRTQEGSGIGLALVRELVKLHGGEVRAESTYGAGSVFTVALPLGKAHLPADRISAARTLASTALGAAPYVEEALRWLPELSAAGPTGRPGEILLDGRDGAPRPPAHAPGERPRILLADDNADMRDYVRRLLAAQYDVRAVADGQAAWAAAREAAPDLILSDVMMPGLDGFALLRRLRAEPRTQDVPVILLSARAGEESRVEGLEAGADDYLVKPFGARELLARVQGHLQLARLRRQAQEALRQSEAQLRDQDRRKDEFLATLAHELRNPLAPLRNALQILKMPRVDPDTVERSRAMMERQVQQLVRLVDDLLDVSRVMRGKVVLRTEAVELAAVVARAVETAQPLVEAQRHELTVEVPDEPLPLQADAVRLAQVVGNLLTNAAKYTEPGGRIRLTARRHGNEAVLRVRDSGIGIAADMLPKVFELFVQADHAATRAQGGLGIGLTLVKNLVAMHGGSVTADSPGLGQGSEFTVRLPLADRKEEPGDSGSREGLPGPLPGSGRRLLVIDDNRDAADSLATLLRLAGHEVRVAHDGPAALELTKVYRPEVVLLDLGMPGMDGYEVARRLRQQPGLERVRLAALTGWGQQEERRRTAAAGFDHHLVKPVDPEALEELLVGLGPPAGCQGGEVPDACEPG
jgi:signal transduction histidine kinase